MEATLEIEQTRINVEFLPSEDELSSIYSEKMASVLQFSIAASEPVDFRLVHDDHLALIILLAAHPFAIGDLTIPLHVSPLFANACGVFTRYRPVFLSATNKPYTPRSGGRPGLAFSGGMDSTAALALLPPTTVPVFLDRPHRAKTTLYNKSAAKATLAFLEAKNIPNISLSTDVEFIRKPIGFPTDLASGIPAIALATHFNFDSIGYGTVMESAYRIGHKKARNYEHSPHYRLWSPLFSSAGIPLILPVAGVSEIGTSTIVHHSQYRDMARSCIRGQWPRRCDKCWKCFRKQLIDQAIKGRTMSDEEFRLAIQSKEVASKLSSEFISHENVLGWALEKMERGTALDLLYQRLVASTYSLNHLNSFYPSSVNLIPPKYRLHVLEQLRNYLPEMKIEDQQRMVAQDFSKYVESTAFKSKVIDFKTLIKN